MKIMDCSFTPKEVIATCLTSTAFRIGITKQQYENLIVGEKVGVHCISDLDRKIIPVKIVGKHSHPRSRYLLGDLDEQDFLIHCQFCIDINLNWVSENEERGQEIVYKNQNS